MLAQRYLNLLWVPSIFVLFGCASIDAVYLEGRDGQIARCEAPWWHAGFFFEGGHETDDELRRKCVQDYESKGFHQIPAPETRR